MGVSKDLIEKVTLLILAAVLTNFFAPYLLKTIEDRRIRHGKVIEAQSKFLDDIAQKLWKWRYMTIKIVYYAGQGNAEKYNISRKEYDEGIWEVFNQTPTTRRLGCLVGLRHKLSSSIRGLDLPCFTKTDDEPGSVGEIMTTPRAGLWPPASQPCQSLQ